MMDEQQCSDVLSSPPRTITCADLMLTGVAFSQLYIHAALKQFNSGKVSISLINYPTTKLPQRSPMHRHHPG